MDPLLSALKAKGVWRGAQKEHYAFFCANCRTPRRLPVKPSPYSIRRITQILLCSAFFTLVCWPLFEIKGMVSFVPFWALFEFLYRSRVRALAVCPNCGFDPFLYLTNLQGAQREFESYWRKRFEEKGVPYPEKKRAPQPQVGNELQPDSRLDSLQD